MTKPVLIFTVAALFIVLISCSSSESKRSGKGDAPSDVSATADALTVLTNNIMDKFRSALPESSSQPIVLSDEEIKATQLMVTNMFADSVGKDEYAVIETSKGTIIFEFYPDKAPQHCANFKKLANSGFYDWTLFHRVIPGFMIQGGDILSKNADPSDDGTGSPGYKLRAEFNDLKHLPGILSMARSTDPNSAGSQFFIMHGFSPQLDGQYSIFGKVIVGHKIVDEIAKSPRNNTDRPNENIYMKKVRVVKVDS